MRYHALLSVLLGIACLMHVARAAELYVGVSTADITPSQPVALDGQRHVRIAKEAATPITATALALESKQGEQSLDQAVIVSCDIVAIGEGVRELVRKKVANINGLDPEKVFLCATHTHTAPVTSEGKYNLPESGVLRPSEYTEWMTSQIAEAIKKAWEKRQPAKVSWAQGQAVVAQNRRALYADGSAKMYGATNIPEFRGLESQEDHNLEVLFFWNDREELIATAINIACPAQEMEGLSVIHADFWHPVRERLRNQYGQDLGILGLTGAGGDVTPHLMLGKGADERMRQLRNLSRIDEIARRIVRGWEEAYEAAKTDMRSDIVFKHVVKTIELPYRQVTAVEAEEARTMAAQFADKPAERWNYLWHQRVVDRYEKQQRGEVETFPMELHVIRLGNVAIATNEFELYTDYGIQIKARSPAVQTFVVQLTGSAGYLPTERAVRGGGYGAVIQSACIGPEGGQVLVDQTVEAIKQLW
ncbi:MAG: hypothetical protein ACUVQG_08405 [Thermogutta sp.]